MRIALCAPYDLTETSGVSQVVRDLKVGIEKRGHECVAITPESFPCVTRVPEGMQSLTLALLTLLSLLVRNPRPDVVHANQPHVQSVAAFFAARLIGARFIITYHSALPSAHSSGAYSYQMWAHVALLRREVTRVFVSRSTRDELGFPGDLVIYNGVDFAHLDTARGRAKGRDRETPTLVFVGRQTETKGFFDMLDVMHSLLEKTGRAKFRLLLVGCSPAPEVARRTVALLALKDFVKDYGVVHDRTALFTVLLEAHLLILPSYREGLPLTVLEAMAAGCVPLVTGVGGIPEVVQDGYSGILVPPGSRDALAHAIVSALSDLDRVAAMSTRAALLAHDRFSIDRTIDQYFVLYGLGGV